MNPIHSNKDFDIINQKIIHIINTYNARIQDFLSQDTIHNLATHLTITIVRLQTKNYIYLSKSQLAKVQEDEVYEYAKEICYEIEQEFDISFPQEEVAVVWMYLTKNHILDGEIMSGFDLLESDIFTVLKNSMQDIYLTSPYDFRKNDTLLIAIGLHLTPAIERLQNKELLKNPLTHAIINDYPLAFSFAKIVNENVKKQYHSAFNDDEVAFIAIHFLNAIQESKK